MTDTAIASAQYIVPGAPSKEPAHNDALERLEQLAQITVVNRTTTSAPSSPAQGAAYIVASVPTGVWSAQTHRVAAYYSGWTFLDPREGWQAYDQGANEALLFDGSVWQLELAKGWELIAATDASGAASVEFTSGIDGTYDMYAIVIAEMTPASDGQEMLFRISTDGGSTWKAGATDYEWTATLSRAAQAGTEKVGSNGANGIRLGGSGIENPGGTAGESYSGVIYIPTPANTAVSKLITFEAAYIGSGGELITIHGGGTYNAATTAIDGFQIKMGFGNISGNFNLYEIKQ